MRACVDTPRGSPERLVVICVHVHVRAQYSWGSEKEATDHNMGDMNGGHANYQWINIQHTAMGHGTVTPPIFGLSASAASTAISRSTLHNVSRPSLTPPTPVLYLYLFSISLSHTLSLALTLPPGTQSRPAPACRG